MDLDTLEKMEWGALLEHCSKKDLVNMLSTALLRNANLADKEKIFLKFTDYSGEEKTELILDHSDFLVNDFTYGFEKHHTEDYVCTATTLADEVRKLWKSLCSAVKSEKKKMTSAEGVETLESLLSCYRELLGLDFEMDPEPVKVLQKDLISFVDVLFDKFSSPDFFDVLWTFIRKHHGEANIACSAFLKSLLETYDFYDEYPIEFELNCNYVLRNIDKWDFEVKKEDVIWAISRALCYFDEPAAKRKEFYEKWKDAMSDDAEWRSFLIG